MNRIIFGEFQPPHELKKAIERRSNHRAGRADFKAFASFAASRQLRTRRFATGARHSVVEGVEKAGSTGSGSENGMR